MNNSKLFLKIKSLQYHEGFIKYFKNTSWLLVEKVIRMGVGLFVGIWVARYLGPDRYGLLSYAQSFVALFAAIATLGLDEIVVRELIKDESKRDRLMGTAFLLKLIGGIVVLLLLAIAVNFTSNDAFTNLIVFILASGTIFQSFNVIDVYFQSKVLSKYVVYANLISLLLSSIIKVVLIVINAPLIAFAWAFLFDSVILALGFIYFYFHNNLSVKNWKFEKTIAIKLLKDSYPLIFTSIAIVVYMRVDQVMIKEILGEKEVGLYSAGIKLVEAFYFIPVLISSSLFPSLVHSEQESDEKFNVRFERLLYSILWGVVFLILPLYFGARYIILILFGSQYFLSYEVLKIYCFILFFSGFGVISSKWLITKNLQKFGTYRTYIALVINVVLNLLLIPKYNIEGAAYASLISQVFASYLSHLFFKETRELFWIQTKFFSPHSIFRIFN